MIKCDICNSDLEIDVDGKAHCRQCGMSYTIESVRNKYQGNINKIKTIKKEHTHQKNYVRLEIKEIQSSFFSKEIAIIAEVLDGELNSREMVCLEGTNSPSYKVQWIQERGNNVRFRLENVSKKTLKVGQILETSYEKEKQFKRIIYKNFQSYDIEENIMINEEYYPVTYMLMKDQEAKLAILLCNSRSYNSKAIQNTINSLEDANIPVQRYYKDFRNDEDYVCKRIKSVL